MKDCRSTLEALPLLLAGGLDAVETAEVQSHLAGCSACAAELTGQQQVDDLLRGAFARQRVDARAVQARVLEHIQGEGARWPGRSPRRRASPSPWDEGFRRALAALLRPGPAFALAAVVLLVGMALFAFPGWQAGIPAVYAAVVTDHYEDVVQKVKKTGWLRADDAVREFTQAQFQDPALAATLAPEGNRLSRVRLSRLAGEDFAHFVYAGSDGHEIVSFFVRPRQGTHETLPGRPAERTADGRPLYAARVRETKLAGFQSGTLTVLVVSELPEGETMRLARATAARLRS